MSGKGKRPRGISSGRYSSIINRYVKGARKVNGLFALESTSSPSIVLAGLQGVFRGGFLGWLPASVDSVQVDSLDSSEESTWPAGPSAKLLILSLNSEPACQGGFQVDSPVRNPVASEIARSSPPYTNRAGEEPWEGAFGQNAFRSEARCELPIQLLENRFLSCR